MGNDLMHVVVYDPDISVKTTLCIRSILEFGDDPDLTAFIPAGKADRVDGDKREWLEERATVLSGETRVDELGPLAKPAAMEAAADNCDHEYLLFLDSDAVLLDPVTVHRDSDADAFAALVADSNQYWAKPENVPKWRELYDRFDAEMPDRRLECRDGEKILPYYNSGVMLVRNNGLPAEYREMAEGVFDSLPPERSYFGEQMGFAIAANQYDVELLPERYHTGMLYEFTSHPDPAVMHYMQLRCLFRVVRPSVRRKFNRIGLDPDLLEDRNAYLEAIKTLRYPVWKHVNDIAGYQLVNPRR